MSRLKITLTVNNPFNIDAVCIEDVIEKWLYDECGVDVEAIKTEEIKEDI